MSEIGFYTFCQAVLLCWQKAAYSINKGADEGAAALGPVERGEVIIHNVSLQYTAFSLNDVTQSQEKVNNTNTRIIKFLFVIHVQQLTALQKSKIIQYIITCIYSVVNILFCQILHKLFTGEYTALKKIVWLTLSEFL